MGLILKTFQACWLLVVVIVPFSVHHLQGQSCETDSLIISTGWEPEKEGVLGVGSLTSLWQVMGDADETTVEPRRAYVIAPHQGWGEPIGISQWISSLPSSTNNANAVHVFEMAFCAKASPQNVQLHCTILADDRARLYLNGALIASTYAGRAFLHPPLTVRTEITHLLVEGENRLRVEVDNTHKVAMGLNLSGVITSEGKDVGMLRCCTSVEVMAASAPESFAKEN